jgi:ribosomal protein S18 acetylase RimI-like enzyme
MSGTFFIRHEHGHLEFRFGPGHTVEIVDILALNEHRREGVGREMLNQLITKFLDGVYNVYAITRKENRIAQQFYLGCGFQHVADLRGFYPDGSAIMYMLKVPLENK